MMACHFFPTSLPFSPLTSSIEDADNVYTKVPPPAPEQSTNGWSGFKVIGDNIDKMGKPRLETIDHH